MQTRSWIVTILILLAFCIYLFYYFYGVERTRAIEGVVSHQRIYARQAANSVNEMVDKWNSVLSYLSDDRNIILMNEKGKDELTKLREALRDEIKSITRVNKDGTIIFTAPYYRNSIGVNISSQKHMAKILSDHKPVVSDVFDAVQGFQAIAIHYPVFRGGAFEGTIALVVDFGQVGRRILKEIETDSSGYAWLLSSEGVELYCPVPGHIGKSIRETAKGFPDLLRVADDMLAGKEGAATYTYDAAVGRIQKGNRIVYFLPVRVNDARWSLAVVYSEDEITNSLTEFSKKLAVIVGCVFFGGVFISYFGIKAWVVVQESEARKKAEEKLKESEERYRNLYENAAIGICRMTPEGRILFANPHLVRMLGFDTWERLAAWNSEERGSSLGFNRQASAGILSSKEEVRGLESKWQKSDGTEIFVRENVRVFYNDNGSVAYYDITAEDITEQKKLQAQLLQSQKMEAIGHLAGGVAHDFNNMIGVILGYAALIEKDLDPSGETYRRMKSIIMAAERSANLSKQLLAFARKQVIAPVVLNLNDELFTVLKILGRLIGENITINLLPGENLWNIKMDPGQIDQLVTNLCTNARDAIQNVGVITLETSNLSVDRVLLKEHGTLTPGEYVVLTCIDTGHGIDSATLEHIFEPFFSTKPRGKGTGLGLATVFGIVQQNSGHIEVQSEAGKGATFRIYLPRFVGEVERRAEAVDVISSPGEGTVLVVEDEEELLVIIGSTLESHGYATLCTTSPRRALELCSEREGRIDLLITDVIMPEMNGKQLQQRIEELIPGIKTLFISGYTADVVAERGILEKETFFLQKPFTPETLVSKVHSILSDS
jgi:PAS domain S-box-containing protein